MSLLLLLNGAQVQSGDRTFTGTWEQTASWAAVMAVPSVEVDFPLQRVEPFVQVYGRFVQRPATWRAEVDVNDDEITLTEIGVL